MTLTSDRLSPILVKELRQGIRSQLFTGAFLLIQALLFLFGLSFLLSDGLQKDLSAGAALFWAMIVLPLLVLVPASASQAIEKEVSGKTIELLLLTRLSSHRIVLGKWASVVVQTSLVLVSALPYIMLRYFLGGIDIWAELEAIAVLLIASSMLAGCALGFWALNVSRLSKWGVVLLALWLLPALFMAAVAPHGGLGAPPGVGVVAWIYGLILTLMMLDAAAARIGPPSENHTSRVRALALAGLLAAFFFSGPLGWFAAIPGLFIAVATAVGSLAEKTKLVPRLYRPFLETSGLPRLVSLPFAPSWAGGVAFTFVVLALVPFLPAFRGEVSYLTFAALVGTLVFPTALTRGIARTKRPLGAYLLVLVLSSVPIFVYALAAGLGLDEFARWLETVSGFFPPFALLLTLTVSRATAGLGFGLAVLLVLTAVSVLLVLRGAREEWKDIVALCESSRIAVSSIEREVTPVGLGLRQESAP